MGKAFLHAAEVIVIGIVVTALGAVIDALTNYHPTGDSATFWGMFGIVLIGALKGLYSWLLTKKTVLETTTTTTVTEKTVTTPKVPEEPVK